MELRQLIQVLDLYQPTPPGELEGWSITPITGGANNLLYHVTYDDVNYAVKFTLKDPRRRAYREYTALALLQSLGLDLAPCPILFDEDTYSLPVIVQSWIEGEVNATFPDTDEAWTGLLNYYKAVHGIEAPLDTLDKPVLYAENADQCKAIIHQKVERLPLDAQPPSLRLLTTRFERMKLPRWKQPTLSLTRTDPNPRNFIYRPDRTWASVDWEYSGVTDPAFEIADLLAHPQFIPLSRDRQEWIIQHYCQGDEDCEIRIRTYWLTMTLWWAARSAQYLYEVPLGLDPRLAQRPPTWKEDSERKYTHYVEMTERLLV
jgi:aminoglycoside phosphotransferase (APT) family kinase protein